MNIHEGSKCSFDKITKKCKEVYNDCEDQTLTSCSTYILKDTSKYCIIDKGLCITQYDQCETYNDEVEEADRNKEDCESVLPRYISEKNSYKCVFSETKTCEKQKLETCEDYEGNNEDFCNRINLLNLTLIIAFLTIINALPNLQIVINIVHKRTKIKKHVNQLY